ncbi:uncharacterized protein [Patagioenas fasciata]|uniref:uncharacterized protein n=1 Tax=Patagioenas fasciata TaxID=372321 RepID=UPI003A992DD1
MEKRPSPPLCPRQTPASPRAGGQVPFGQAAPRSRHAEGQGTPTPRRDSLSAVRHPPSLPRAARCARRDGGPVIPAPPHGWLPPRSGNTSRPEEGGVGRGVNKHLGRLARGTGYEPGAITSFSWWEKGMCPLTPAERPACVRLSSSSTPDLNAISRHKTTSPSLPDSDAPSPGLLEGRHSPIVSHPPPPLASKSSSDPTGHLPSPGGLRAAGTGAQRPPLRAGERSFPLLRSGRAAPAPAPSPQPGASKVSAGGSQPRRHWRLHSPRDEMGGGATRPRPSVPLAFPRPSPRRRAARRTGPAGGQKDPGATGDSGPASCPLPGAWCTLSAGRGGPAPAWQAASSPENVSGTVEPGTERLPPAPPRPLLLLPARPQRPLGAALRSGSLRAGASQPPPSLSARLPPSPSFLPSLPPAPSPLPAFPRRLPSVPGCPLRVSLPRLPAASAASGGPGRGRPPLPFRGCRERDARRRSAPGSAAAAVTVCLCHVCAWAGGGAGPRRSQPADTPPSDRRRAPNQQQRPLWSARPRRAAPRAVTPGPGRRVTGQTASPSGGRGCEGRAGSAPGGAANATPASARLTVVPVAGDRPPHGGTKNRTGARRKDMVEEKNVLQKIPQMLISLVTSTASILNKR